ncbi:mevalonate kinase, partial [Candidatus Binatia bacterium]|nr:mevalonate kinase [Candidatus Binatia bacterium]
MTQAIARAGRGRGAGKVILLGEHVVVHGQPAIVAGLDRGVEVTITPCDELPALDDRVVAAVQLAARLLGLPETGFGVRITGDLPIGMGLGSSAALAVALLRALAVSADLDLSPETIAVHAHDIERLFHGTPSGVDSTAATHGGLLWFQAGPPAHHERLRLPGGSLPLVVVLSRTVHATAKTVGSLRERAAAAPEVYRPVFAAVGELVRAARVALEAGDRHRLGDLMTMNHGLLRACGVSTPELDAIVDAALAAGARGAKLTGAGGGGAVIA